MRHCAALHGAVFDSTLPTVGEKGFSLEKIVLWSTGRTEKRRKEGEAEAAETATMGEEERGAVRFLERLMDLDPTRRISAEEALGHEFLILDGGGEGKEADEEEDEVEML